MSRTNATLKGNRCYCRGCGEYFSVVSNFDKHRIWKDDKRVCADPESLGMEIKQTGQGTYWGMPGYILPEIDDSIDECNMFHGVSE